MGVSRAVRRRLPVRDASLDVGVGRVGGRPVRRRVPAEVVVRPGAHRRVRCCGSTAAPTAAVHLANG
jgi:hypothetical protein